LSGTTLLIIEITALEQISTTIVAMPIIKPFIALDVVPSVAHIPRSNTSTGLPGIIPLYINFHLLAIAISF
jgi:hypothetical protein